jgi:hypothetical protein
MGVDQHRWVGEGTCQVVVACIVVLRQKGQPKVREIKMGTHEASEA